jgi:hypothetical protein
VFTQVITAALQGEIPGPMAHQMPNLRSIASQYDIMNDDMYNQANPFGSAGSSGQIFGKGMIVESNIQPNLHLK